jgi:hypothetical protein
MRVEGKCAGDCSRCELLEQGKVDMIPCVLDQMFQLMQRLEKCLTKADEQPARLADLPKEDE